jgi:hypothetical protein
MRKWKGCEAETLKARLDRFQLQICEEPNERSQHRYGFTFHSGIHIDCVRRDKEEKKFKKFKSNGKRKGYRK